MIETMIAGGTLAQRVQRIQDALRRAGLSPIDMRRAGTLETDVLLPQMPMDGSILPPEIELLEGPIEHRLIVRKNETQFSWFIDGSQKTMPVWRIGVVPIVVSIVVAGVLERDDAGGCTLLPGSLTETISWIVPQQTGDRDIRTLVDVLESLGQEVYDPLDGQDNYQQLAGMYDQVLLYANETAGKTRERAELRAVRFWEESAAPQRTDRWLVVDGQLTADLPNAIGFIKDPGRAHLVGDDAMTLLSLPPGHRTTAFRTTSRARARTHWYQRMWPAEGLDARHALIRIEASGDMSDPDEIDAIASWLMAERVPRPTSDSRWPTLLYPVHILERILKRRINQITTGWPV